MKLVLGKEHDDQFRAALRRALDSVAARRLWHWSGMAGSQQVDVAWYLVGWRALRVQTENYQGLSLHGPKTFVKRVTSLVREHTRAPAAERSLQLRSANGTALWRSSSRCSMRL